MGIDIRHTDTIEVGYDEFCGALAARDLQPLWKIAKQLMPEVPLPTTLPWLWKWDDILPLAKRAGELITLERGGDRRVLALANPGLRGLPFTSTTLWGALQYLGPHESAPAHRHTPSAIRFVLTGSGVYTTVNGDACDMEPGDLILTPIWNWHDHNNKSDQPVVWFDGLDTALVKQRWGEGISGNVIVSAWTIVLMIPLLVVFVIGIAATRHAPAGRIAVFALAAAVFVALVALSGVVRQENLRGGYIPIRGRKRHERTFP